MPRISARFEGLEAVLKAVGELEPKVIRPAVRQGVNDATRLLLREAKANLRGNRSVDTGTLLRSLGRRVVSYRQGRGVAGIVGPRIDTGPRPKRGGGTTSGKAYSRTMVRREAKTARRAVPAWYVHLVEFGSAPHALSKGSKRVIGTHGRAGPQRGRMHPGAAARPFLRPAFDAHRAACVALVKARVRAAVKAAASNRGVR